MPKLRLFRLSISVLCVLASMVCVVWAKPKSPAQRKAQAKCDKDYYACENGCAAGSNFWADKCHRDCLNTLRACYQKGGLQTISTGGSDVPQATTRGKAQAGHTPVPGLQTSPSATPSKLQPQGTLMQNSPTPTPAKISRGTPKPKKN
jgi:hypothetical protein